MMLSAPSPLPTAVAAASFGGAARDPLAAGPADFDELQALTTNSALAAIAVRLTSLVCRMGTPPYFMRHPRAGCPGCPAVPPRAAPVKPPRDQTSAQPHCRLRIRAPRATTTPRASRETPRHRTTRC